MQHTTAAQMSTRQRHNTQHDPPQHDPGNNLERLAVSSTVILFLVTLLHRDANNDITATVTTTAMLTEMAA
jgi:hypothetical protein